VSKNEAAATDSKQMLAKTQAAPEHLHHLLLISIAIFDLTIR